MPPACEVRVRARVVSARPSFGRGRGMGVEAKLERADGMALAARFFNAGYLRRHLIPGEWFLWEGRTDDAKVGLLLHPAFIHLPSGATASRIQRARCPMPRGRQRSAICTARRMPRPMPPHDGCCRRENCSRWRGACRNAARG